jgi:hypothetical protein
MKTNLFTIFLLVGLTCHTQVFSDELPIVYGFKLGSQPTLLNCTDDAARDLTKSPGVIYYKVACFTKLQFPSTILIVNFPSDETPSLAKEGTILLDIYEDTIQSISWGTKGVYDTDIIIEALTKKFGKPTKATNIPISNMNGQRFLNWSVTWKRNGFQVSYETVNFLQQINYGAVKITTDNAEKRRLLILEKKETGKKYPL